MRKQVLFCTRPGFDISGINPSHDHDLCTAKMIPFSPLPPRLEILPQKVELVIDLLVRVLEVLSQLLLRANHGLDLGLKLRLGGVEILTQCSEEKACKEPTIGRESAVIIRNYPCMQLAPTVLSTLSAGAPVASPRWPHRAPAAPPLPASFGRVP